MKNAIFLLSLILALQGYSQNSNALYKNLHFKMPIKEAKKEFRANKGEYQIISFGNGVDWQMYPINLGERGGMLLWINLVPSNSYGVDHDTAKLYLVQSRDFFEEKEYVVFHEPENWSIPILFDNTNKYGLLMHDPEKTIVVTLTPQTMSSDIGRYLPVLTINNYENFMNFMEKDEQELIKARKKTGF